MKKKVILILMIALMVIGLSSCGLGEQLKIKYVAVDGGVALETFKGTSKELQFSIPDEYEGAKVTNLKDFCIANAEYVESINIGANVKEIGLWAISNCPNLKEINVDKNNPYYESVDGVLYTEDQKTLVLYPNMKAKSYTVLDGTEIIWNNAFYKCSNIEEIKLPNTVQKISDRAFMKATSLINIEIPSSVTFLGVDSFSFCSKLESVFIPKSVTQIGDYAFFSCSAIKEIKAERENFDGVTLGADCFPVKGGGLKEKIPVVYSQIREEK